MAEQPVGLIVEGLLKELGSDVPSQTVLLEIQQNRTLATIFSSRPRYQLIDALSDDGLKKLLTSFLAEVKSKIFADTTEEKLVQDLSVGEIARQAEQTKAAALGNKSLESIRGSRREWVEKLVDAYVKNTKASTGTQQELTKKLTDLPVSASGADVERVVSDVLSSQKQGAAGEARQLIIEASQKQEDVATAASSIAIAIAGHDSPRPDVIATIIAAKIDEQKPLDASGYQKIIEEVTPLTLIQEAVTSRQEVGGYKPYFQMLLPDNVNSKPIDERLRDSPKQHAEAASAIVSSAAERILKNPELRKKLAPDEIALLKSIGERGFTSQKITATKWLAQLFTTPPEDHEFKRVNESIFSLFELKRLNLLPTSAFAAGAPRPRPGATMVEKYTVWHPMVLFYATIAQTTPQELMFSPAASAGQWLVGWATQTAASVEFVTGAGTRSAITRAGGTFLAGVLTGGWGAVAKFLTTDMLLRGGESIWARAKGWFGTAGKEEAWGMNGVLLPLVLVLAPFFILLLSITVFGPVLTAFGITSPYAGTGATGTAANANYGGLAILGSFNQFNLNNVGGIVTSRGATRPLTTNEQAKVAAAIGAFPSFALFGTPLGQAKINLTAFPSSSPDDVVGFSPPSQAGNIALYQNAFSFSDQTLARLLAHELTHQIEWFRPGIYQAFLSGTTTVPRGYCGPLGTYIKSLPETSEETFAEAAAMYIIGDPRLKEYCGGKTYVFINAMFMKGVSL